MIELKEAPITDAALALVGWDYQFVKGVGDLYVKMKAVHLRSVAVNDNMVTLTTVVVRVSGLPLLELYVAGISEESLDESAEVWLYLNVCQLNGGSPIHRCIKIVSINGSLYKVNFGQIVRE